MTNNERLLMPRYEVIADYPGTPFKIGEILTCDGSNWGTETHIVTAPYTYPDIFKPLQWWEHRTIEELKSVKYCKVVIYVGYWRVGDVVNCHLEVDKNIIPTGYRLTNHLHPLKCVEPATVDDYNKWQTEVMKRTRLSSGEFY